MFSNSISIPSQSLIKNDLLAYLDNKTIEESFRSIDMKIFKDYTGTYLLKEANITIQIVDEDSKMYMVVDAQNIKSELAQKSETSLYDITLGVILTKIEGDNDSLTFSQNGLTTIISKVNSEN